MILDYPDRPGNDILWPDDELIQLSPIMEFSVIISTNLEKNHFIKHFTRILDSLNPRILITNHSFPTYSFILFNSINASKGDIVDISSLAIHFLSRWS